MSMTNESYFAGITPGGNSNDKCNKLLKQKRAKANQIFQIIKIKNKKKWTKDEDLLLIKLAEKYKEKHWKEISKNFVNKNALQCFSRYKRIRPGIVKGSWSKEEDDRILNLVQVYGKSWSKISKILVSRNGKQIRDRFINVLDPEIKKGKFTEEEDKILIRLYLYYGPRWATIAKHFSNRTADMIKNRFHSSIKKVFFGNLPLNAKNEKSMNYLREEKYNLILSETMQEQGVCVDENFENYSDEYIKDNTNNNSNTNHSQLSHEYNNNFVHNNISIAYSTKHSSTNTSPTNVNTVKIIKYEDGTEQIINEHNNSFIKNNSANVIQYNCPVNYNVKIDDNDFNYINSCVGHSDNANIIYTNRNYEAAKEPQEEFSQEQENQNLFNFEDYFTV